MMTLLSPDAPAGDAGEEMGRKGFLKIEGEPLENREKPLSVQTRYRLFTAMNPTRIAKNDDEHYGTCYSSHWSASLVWSHLEKNENPLMEPCHIITS